MPKTQWQSEFHDFINELLQEQGVSASPEVPYQLAAFGQGFLTRLRSDAQDLTVGNESITTELIQLAQELRSFSKSRIQSQDIYKFAAQVNQRPFPKIEPHQGLSLPQEQHCLLANNYQYKSGEVQELNGRKRKELDAEESLDDVISRKKPMTASLDFDILEREIIAELNADSKNSDEPVVHPIQDTNERTLEGEGHGGKGPKLKRELSRGLTPETRAVVSIKHSEQLR